MAAIAPYVHDSVRTSFGCGLILWAVFVLGLSMSQVYWGRGCLITEGIELVGNLVGLLGVE